jgi:hypothetical protein
MKKKTSSKKRFESIAFQVDMARQVETPASLKKIIDFGGKTGYNELFLYAEGALEYKTHPECSLPWALKQNEFLKLQKYAKEKYKMRLIPVIPVLGHANFVLKPKELEHLREIKNENDAVMKCDMRQFCTSMPETYKVIEDLLLEWTALTDAPYIHIGGDESWNFALCPECKKQAKKIGRGKMLAEHYNKVNQIVKKGGKQTMMWHDMLFYYDDCLPHLDKDIIMTDWHYKPIERHPGISIYNWEKTDFLGTYEKEKISAYICPKSKFEYEYETHNIKSFIEYAETKKTIGFLNTIWEMKFMPFASCYPSLAYGAAACIEKNPPEPRKFLASFAKDHFKTGQECLPFLVDLFEKAAGLSIYTGNLIDYQDPLPDINLSEKMNEALTLTKKLESKTEDGKDYLEALELIFKRNSITLRIKGLINEIARNYLPGREKNKELIKNFISDIEKLSKKIPQQIKLEQKIWNKWRPKEEKCHAVIKFHELQDATESFLKDIKKLTAGKIKPNAVLPVALELTMVNNDCSWQYLSVNSSVNGKKYSHIGNYAQCGPFGRYIKTYILPHKAKYIKLELTGLGQLLFHYARVIGPGMELSPEKLLQAKGNVINPEHILKDDYKPSSMGSVEAKKYFSQGKEQALSSIEIKMA